MALVKSSQERDLDAIKSGERAIIADARLVVERGAIDAADIDDEGPTPEDWSARRARIARDMRKARRNAPMYIDVLADMLSNYEKLQAAKSTPVSLNIGAINVVSAPDYPVIDITPVAEDK